MKVALLFIALSTSLFGASPEWKKFELSIQFSGGYQEALELAAKTEGLEALSFDTLLDEQDLDNFIEELFNTPYQIPHFCYGFRDLKGDEIWERSDGEILEICLDSLKRLIEPLANESYVLRTIAMKGSHPKYDYYKARLVAEDQRSKRSVVINFDIVLD